MKTTALLRFVAAAMVIAQSALGSSLASAQTAAGSEPVLTREQEALANEITNEFMSPFCPGRLLRDCPSGAASELKQKIRAQIATGKSRAELEQFLVGLYGDQVWAAPPRSGFGLVAWLAPAVFLCLGLVFIGWWLRHVKARKEEATPTLPAIDPALQARIDDEVSR